MLSERAVGQALACSGDGRYESHWDVKAKDHLRVIVGVNTTKLLTANPDRHPPLRRLLRRRTRRAKGKN
jgi:hypothetical protein